MLLLHQLKTWMFWKAKIRILQLWSNFKLFNVSNSYIIPILSLVGPLIGIVWSFTLGFGLSYLFDRYISEDPYHLWQMVFFITIIEAFDRGLQNGRWISSTDEEAWLLASTPFTTTKYVLFLWIDEEVWQNKTQIFSTLALLLGVYITFPIHLGKLFIALLLLNVLGLMIALLTTLIQYYIIKKSVYLKGRGIITNILIPLITSVLAFYGLKYLMPWIRSFPKIENEYFVKEYLVWLQAIAGPLWDFSKGIVSVFDYDLYPYSLLARYLLKSDFTAIIYIFLYIILFLIMNVIMLRLIEGKTSKVIVKKSKLDDFLLACFMKVNGLFHLFHKDSIRVIHVKYFMSSLLQDYLTKRHIFAVFGGRLWIYFAFILSIVLYVPGEYKVKVSLMIAIIIVVIYPTYMLWTIYSKLKIKLAFDAEGVHLQVLMGYGASPEYLYALKTRVLQVLVFPGYMALLFLSLFVLPLKWYFIVSLVIVSFILFVIVSHFIVLASFVLPHYEFFNKQQIGEYPDQLRALDLIRSIIHLLTLPSIPILMYATGVIQANIFILVSFVWMITGGLITFLLLRKLYNQRILTFHIEEISLDRVKVIDEAFWKKRTSVLIATILIYLGTIYLTFKGEFLFAGILYMIPMVGIKLILLSSFRKAI